MKNRFEWLWPVAGFVSLIVLWWGLIVVRDVPKYIAPKPGAVWGSLVDNASLLLDNLWPTATAALGGFIIGNLIAVILATIFVHSARARKMYFPVVVVFNTIPIIALSPILILIFGLTLTSKMIVAAIICLFPTLVNMLRGFESVSSSELELMRVMSASRTEVFLRLRLPRSVPFLFAALKIAATSCVIGAIVSEWIGAEKGLGVLIIQTTFDYRTELLYAAIAVSSALALVLFMAVTLAERFLVRWRTN